MGSVAESAAPNERGRALSDLWVDLGFEIQNLSPLLFDGSKSDWLARAGQLMGEFDKLRVTTLEAFQTWQAQ